MIARTSHELETLRECGRRLSAVLGTVVAAVRPGVATAELDLIAEREIYAAGGAPVFKGYRSKRGERPFPASLCTSVNDEVVHAIPRAEKILREGDIIGLDIGMKWPSGIQSAKRKAQNFWEGLITDMAVTVPVGRISPLAGRLLSVTRRALEAGIAILKPGIQLGDLGHTIQQVIEADGFGVVRELVGHGVGRQLHEAPPIPNFGAPDTGPVIRGGMTLAIEPMATLGDYRVKLDADGWTFRTRDGSLAAHFEHTVVVVENGAEVLTQP